MKPTHLAKLIFLVFTCLITTACKLENPISSSKVKKTIVDTTNYLKLYSGNYSCVELGKIYDRPVEVYDLNEDGIIYWKKMSTTRNKVILKKQGTWTASKNTINVDVFKKNQRHQKTFKYKDGKFTETQYPFKYLKVIRD